MTARASWRRVAACFFVPTLAALGLAGCGTTTSSHRLPTYESPIARTDFQNVRTTAYTHTESDHLAYGNHNALGGRLRVASRPSTLLAATFPPPEERDASDASEEIAGYRPVANTAVAREAAYVPAVRATRAVSAPDDDPPPAARPVAVRTSRPVPVAAPAAAPASDDGNPPWVEAYLRKHPEQRRPVAPRVNYYQRASGATAYAPPAPAPVVYGSAAADWSRWPVGTVFRIESTGQIYQVDDYGWALAGRNTIDLYQPSRAAMNSWGVRRELIHVLRWGSRDESLRRLRNHQRYKHIRRMVLELEGHHRAAASLD